MKMFLKERGIFKHKFKFILTKSHIIFNDYLGKHIFQMFIFANVTKYHWKITAILRVNLIGFEQLKWNEIQRK